MVPYFFILDARNQGYINSDTAQVDSSKISSLRSASPSSISVGGNAQWINSTMTSSSNPWYTIFKITFCNDCPAQAYVVLNIYATGWFWAFRSIPPWHWIGSGPAWTIHTFTVPVSCGKNEILIYVWGTRNAIKHWITQDQSNCYDCKNSMTGFYNRDTCKCECLSKCDCRQPHNWYDYPTCGCMCKFSQLCVKPKYWNAQKCACVCPPICCPKGYYPSQETCSCKWSWTPVDSIYTAMP